MIRTLAAVFLTGTCIVAAAAPAAAQTRAFNIPAGSLKAALNAYVRQSGRQLIFKGSEMDGVRSNGARGNLSADAALSAILSGSGFLTRKDASGAVAIVRRADGPQSLAPTGEGGPDSLAEVEEEEEIVVTASKRPERLKDVPSAVTALTGESLLQQGATKLEDYAARVPGFTVQNVSVGGGLNKLTLRGITTGLTGNPTVGFYVDDTPFGATGGVGSSVLSPDLDPADIERIEVLRGPQGTLYGASSMGGLIKFVTRAPSTTEFSGRVQADLVAVDHGDVGYALRGSINVPLSETLAVRVNGYMREDPGFVDDPSHGERNVNENRFAGGRVSLLWQPTAVTSVRLSATIQHQENDGSGTIDVNSFTFQPLLGDLQHSRPPGTDSLNTTLKLYDVRLNHDFGWAELMSVSSWGKNKFDQRFDFTPTLTNLLPALFGTTGGGSVDTVNNLSKFTQELRLTSPSRNRIFWQVGLLYTSEHAFASQGITPVDPTTGAVLLLPELLNSRVNSSFKEWAAFGTIGYKFSDKFDVSIGGRFSRNKQHAAQVDTGVLGSGGGESRSEDTSFTFLISPRYRINDNLMVYGRIASGYRPGGPNLLTAGGTPTFGPDRLVNYEVGLKGDLFDKVVNLDLSAFLIEWKDIQLSQLTSDGLGYFGNGGGARSKGIEASTVVRPMRGLQIAGNITYLDAYLSEDLAPPLSAVGQKGDQLPSAPRWSGSLNVDYDFEIAQEWSAFVGASWRYIGDRQGDFATVFSFGRPRAELPSYDAFDLRAGVNYAQWTLSAYLRNLTDKRGYAASFAQGAVTSVTVTQPRTFGLSLTRQF